MTDTTPCPCCSGESYRQCCKPRHTGEAPAPTPEALMRSRYCAFSMNLVDYVVETQHPQHRSADIRAKIENAKEDHQWLGLQIVNAEPARGDRAQVEFVAFVQAHGRPFVEQLHELSSFIFDNERWYYTHGDFLPAIKLGRNDPCWCGSGKKLKKCHQGMNIS